MDENVCVFFLLSVHLSFCSEESEESRREMARSSNIIYYKLHIAVL